MHDVYIAIGANLARLKGISPSENCWWAMQRLVALPSLRLHRLSHWYQTAPVPASPQPDFINGVAWFYSGDRPSTLLRQLQAIEDEAGRVRTAPNAARVLDLDLLAVGDTCLDDVDLTLPHPRMHLRAFVLHPLADLTPAWRHPRLGRTAAELRDAIEGQRIERLPDRPPSST